MAERNIILDMNTDGYLEYKKFVPHMNMEFYVITTNGKERRAISTGYGIGYTFTDCTHPLQNCHLSIDDVVCWKYVNIEHLINGHYSVNHYQRQKEGEVILRSVKKRTIVSRILSIFKS